MYIIYAPTQMKLFAGGGVIMILFAGGVARVPFLALPSFIFTFFSFLFLLLLPFSFLYISSFPLPNKIHALRCLTDGIVCCSIGVNFL